MNDLDRPSWASNVRPREWQRAALSVWERKKSGVVRVVTGGGKTIFAELCIRSFRECHPKGRIVIVVPTTALLDQWVVSLREDMGVDAQSIACFSAEEKPSRPEIINILVINTARTIAEPLSHGVSAMLVVDECHRAGSGENAKALRGVYAATLGLSATPEREYDQGFEEYVVPALGPVIYDYSYVDAARDHVISPFALHNVRVAMQHHEQQSFDKFSRRIASERRKIAKGVGSEERLTRLLQQRAAVLATVKMRVPVAVKIAERHIGQRTIIFHERVDAANTVFAILKKRGRSATIYHSGIAPALRRDNLRLYRRGVFDVLVCCRALDEGINVPETAVAVVASSTASVRQRVQRLGRVLRPAKGKEFADIYTVYASDLEEERLNIEAQSFAGISEVSWSRVRAGDAENSA